MVALLPAVWFGVAHTIVVAVCETGGGGFKRDSRECGIFPAHPKRLDINRIAGVQFDCAVVVDSQSVGKRRYCVGKCERERWRYCTEERGRRGKQTTAARGLWSVSSRHTQSAHAAAARLKCAPVKAHALARTGPHWHRLSTRHGCSQDRTAVCICFPFSIFYFPPFHLPVHSTNLSQLFSSIKPSAAVMRMM